MLGYINRLDINNIKVMLETTNVINEDQETSAAVNHILISDAGITGTDI